MRHKYCILLHFSDDLLRFWGNILSDQYPRHFSKPAFQALNEIFVEKLNSLEKKIYLSCASSDETLSFFQSQLQDAEIIDHSHELFLINEIFKKNQDIESVVYFDSIFPLLDMSIFSEIMSNHFSYSADYSYAENLPPGICPPIFSKSLIRVFEIEDEGAFKQKKFPLPLCTYVEKNINDFHVEIHYEEPDLRILRLDFSGKSLRSLIKTDKVLSHKLPKDSIYPKLHPLLEDHPEILYTLPSYLEIELISDCEYKCIFCPRQYIEVKSQIMDDHALNRITDFLDNSLGDTSLCLGGLGEPLQHPKIDQIIPQLLAQDQLKLLLIETNGYYLDKIESILESEEFKKIRLIININALKGYAEIHGVEASHLERVKSNLNHFITRLKKINEEHLSCIHIQMLKIKENEEEIDDLNGFCEDMGVNFLLQKYNSYISLMPERRVSDMTPLERSPCWHLRRDLFIRANGDVVFCKQDIQSGNVSANLNDASIDDIWKSKQSHWEDHFRKDYSKTPDCSRCDEYFTFNY